MTGHNIGFHTEELLFEATITVGVPDSGFEFEIGVSGEEGNIAFSGYSGYLFDTSGHMFGGYQKDRAFTISGAINMTGGIGSYSYYHEGLLMANCLEIHTETLQDVTFEDYEGRNSAVVRLSNEEQNVFALASSESLLFMTSDGYYLGAVSGINA